MNGVEAKRQREASKKDAWGSLRRFSSTLLFHAVFVCVVTSLAAQQRRQPFEQQMQDNQRRLENIRRERSTVEEELSRLNGLATGAHIPSWSVSRKISTVVPSGKK